MKKTISAILAASSLALGSAQAQDLSISSTVGFESVYVFRGVEFADETFMGAVDLAYGDFYAGVWTAQPITKGFDNEIDFYGGYGIDLGNGVGLDIGGTVYYFPETDGDTTTEPFIGVNFDTDLAPAVYVYYDFDLETLTIEGSVGYSFPIDDVTSFDVGAYLGWVEPDVGDSAYYLGGTADISYSFNDAASGSIGIRLSDLEDGSTEFFWGAHFSAGF
ncbi:MAG: TorF family putative porin [Opitutales bacterium]